MFHPFNVFFVFISDFQALRLFRLAGELEGKAAALRKEALQHLTIALAGTDTKELFSLLTMFFGKGTDVDPFSFIDGAPLIKRPLDLTDTESETEGGGGEDTASVSSRAPDEPSTSSEPPTKKTNQTSPEKLRIPTSVSMFKKLLAFYLRMPGISTIRAFQSYSWYAV